MGGANIDHKLDDPFSDPKVWNKPVKELEVNSNFFINKILGYIMVYKQL